MNEPKTPLGRVGSGAGFSTSHSPLVFTCNGSIVDEGRHRVMCSAINAGLDYESARADPSNIKMEVSPQVRPAFVLSTMHLRCSGIVARFPHCGA